MEESLVKLIYNIMTGRSHGGMYANAVLII